MREPFEDLSPVEGGFVLGAAMSGGDASALEGDAGRRCREALAVLKALSRDERATRLARLSAEALAPVPAAVEAAPRERLIAALAPHPPDIVAALVAGLSPVVVGAADALLASGGRRLRDVAPAAMEAEALADLRRAVFGPLAES